MSYPILSRLLELTNVPSLSDDQREEAVSLMRKLREYGFTNREIMVLVKGRWKEPTIKRFTRGVKVTSTEARDRVLETFINFTASGRTPEDVDTFLEMKKVLDSEGVMWAAVVEFVKIILGQKIDFRRLLDLFWRISDSEQSLDETWRGLDALFELEILGISRENIVALNQRTRKFGGLENFLEVTGQYHTLRDYQKAVEVAKEILQSHEEEIKEIKNFIEKKQAESLLMRNYVDIAEALVNDYSFDLPSLKSLMDTARKFGNPTSIFEALNAHQNLDELKKETQAKRAELERLSTEITNKESELSALNSSIERANRAIGEIQANEKRSLVLQTIADLIDETETTEIKPDTFLRTSLLILTGIHSYGKRYSSRLGNWEREVNMWLQYAIEKLTQII